MLISLCLLIDGDTIAVWVIEVNSYFNLFVLSVASNLEILYRPLSPSTPSPLFESITII